MARIQRRSHRIGTSGIGRSTAGSFAFSVAVMVNIVASVRKERAAWVGNSALFPLASLMPAGFHMFVLPYVAKSRSTRSISGVE